MITKQDFLKWKEDSITRAFYEVIHDRIEDAKDILSYQAGNDPLQDNFYRGFIYAYREFLEFKVEDDGEKLQ